MNKKGDTYMHEKSTFTEARDTKNNLIIKFNNLKHA